MKSPLIYDQRDSKWKLLGDILKIFGSRRVKQEIAKQGIKPAVKAGVMFRVMMIALFFYLAVSYVLRELKEREELHNFAGIGDVPSESQMYEFLSRFSEEQMINCVLGILNSLASSRKRGKAVILVDSTDIQFDLNWRKRKITKKFLENLPCNWFYSKSKGFYIVFKLNVAIDYQTLRPLAFILHEKCIHDSKLFEPVMDELLRRRFMRKGDYQSLIKDIIVIKII